jgi:uncharacterized protein YqgV (UPF0045/DUF77 family)
MNVTAQFSIYPLGVTDLHPPLEAAVAAARQLGATVQVGRMASFVEGDADLIFAALRAAFSAVAERGDAVMVVTISNAC